MKKSSRNFVLKTHNLTDLIIAPTQDALSDYEPARSGEAVLPRAIRKWEATGRWEIKNIEIHLSHSALNATPESDVKKMLHRYLEKQLADNQENLFIFKRNASRVFRNSFLFLVICMAIVSILSNENFLPNMPPLLRTSFVEGVTVIGWVALWRPVEMILDELGILLKTRKIFQKLIKVPIVIKPDESF